LVRKAFERSSGGGLTQGAALLERYIAWAPSIDDLGPVKIDHDVDGLLPDPRDPDHGLLTEDSRRAVYRARVDLLAVDATDSYWVVRHQLVSEWQPVETLLLDEVAVAACWAWEQAYLGMDIAGTIHNEIHRTLLSMPTRRRPRLRWRSRGGTAQHEPSGGGRSIPQHRRRYGRPAEPAEPIRLDQRTAGPIRRTRIRRSRREIAGMGEQIAWEALAMSAEGVPVYPTPAAHCTECAYLAPCLAITVGADLEAALTGYRKRPAEPPRVRLGQTTWGVGRGAAPPKFTRTSVPGGPEPVGGWCPRHPWRR
jgi:hypothetical protein